LLIEPMQTLQTEERRPERFAAYIAARRFDPPRSLLIFHHYCLKRRRETHALPVRRAPVALAELG
jgi:hypothetical protein